MGVFKFNKNKLEHYIRYELKMSKQLRDSFEFIFPTMEKIGNSITLESLDNIKLHKNKANKGKNYDWLAVFYQEHKFLIRTYNQHLTVFYMVKGEFGKNIGAFTFYSEVTGMSDGDIDARFDNPFLDLNNCFEQIVTLLVEKSLYAIDCSLEVPDYVKVRLAFDENTFYSFDKTIFCYEEIEHFHLKLFAETKMVERLNEIQDWIDKTFYCIGHGDCTIKAIKTEVKDDYYHNTGISLVDAQGRTKFEDVYSLTGYYFDFMFEIQKEEK